MARYIRIPTAGQGGESPDVDWTAILSRLLNPASKLARLANLGDAGAALNGLSGLAGLAGGIQHGDPVQSIGGAINVGSGLAKLLEFPDLASGLSLVGGPLAFGSALANGDPLGASLSGVQTASTISGLLDGPTIGSLLSSAAEALGLTSSGAAGAGGGMTAGLTAGLPTMAAAAPFAVMGMGALHAAMTGGGDMFDSMFGEDRVQAVKQRDEWKRAGANLGEYLPDRVAGAGLFDHLADYDTPDEILQGLGTANQGLIAGRYLPSAITQINNGEKVAKIPGRDLSGLIDASPELEAKNYASWLPLMDRANAQGLDLSKVLTNPIAFGTSDDYLTPMHVDVGGDRYKTAAIDLIGKEHKNYYVGDQGPVWTGFTWEQDYQPGAGKDAMGRLPAATQESLDLNGAIASLGGALGIDALKLPGGGWDDKLQEYKPGALTDTYKGFGGYLAPEQLSDYGITSGNYMTGLASFLKGLDPTVEQNPLWKTYGLG